MHYYDSQVEQEVDSSKAAPSLAQHGTTSLKGRVAIVGHHADGAIAALIPLLNVEGIKPIPVAGGHMDPRSHISRFFNSEAPWLHSRHSRR